METTLKQRLAEKFNLVSLSDQSSGNTTEDSAEDSAEDSTDDSTKDSIKDSTEQQYIERKIHKMGEEQISSCTKSYSRTKLESAIFDHTWTIEQYKHFSTIEHKIPSIPKIGQCAILMNILRYDNSSIRAIRLNILTENPFYGSCTTVIMRLSGETVSSKYISGHISNMTLLAEFLTQNCKLDFGNTLVVNCRFEIFCNLITNTISMNLLPLSTELSRKVEYFEDSIFDKQANKDEESIKFMVEEKPYVIAKKSLCAINSSYFKNICLTHDEKEKDMTSELVTHNEVESFKQILLYITTGSIEQRGYNTLKDLLTAADKYDVPCLKSTCEHYLLHYITINNAIDLLQFALSSNAKFLKTHSENFIKFYLKQIKNTKEFRDLSQENLNMIMELMGKLPEGSTHHYLLPFKADKELTFANIGM
ncbi:protein maternal effect lethal 26-like [Temnothorax americanus]|uniref:protein maternal effect lethal 26-like n=1 Tax=Temnothorax americanus TaxID=1964332 RepID=UPI00406865C2